MNKNNYINKKVTTYFVLSLLFTIFLPVGILLIVFFAGRPAWWQVLLFVLGIVMVVLGFYGSPMLWTKFGDLKSKQNLCRQIASDNIQDIEKLAFLNNRNAQDMLEIVKELVAKRYLTGYEIVDNKYIVPANNATLSREEILKSNGNVSIETCEGCGAKVEIIGNKVAYCPYCGRLIKGASKKN